ncbi:MAG: P-loop NTPase [Aeromicrobium sp.]|uniref:AAA family ATPase n=1 Tax=Aeromicrobium sp. TaxID=1871063 RepID=UPI002627A63C|nr:P-loop NTPase [Aeromicrobium sp.]MDF1706344.1 P-loop NTPase [Aeromicrobium sp.]
MIGIVLVVGTDDETAENIGAAIGYRAVALSAASVSAPSVSLLRGMDAAQLPGVMVFTDEVPFERSISMAAEVHAVRPDIVMVLVSNGEAPVLIEAMRAGIRDVASSLEDATFLSNLRATLDSQGGANAAGLSPSRPSQPVDFTSRTITVLSPKGGVGKTNISVNLAVALAEQSPMDVVLVDLDLMFGDVSTVLDLHPTHTLEDAFKAGGRDSLLLKTFLTVHDRGFYVLCGAESPAANDNVSGADVAELIRQLQSQFRYVVVDTSAGLDDATLAALEVSHDAVVVTTMDMACLRSVRKAVELLGELTLLPASKYVAVNFADKQSGLRIKDVEAVIGLPVDIVLPRTPEVQAAANRGVPVLTVMKSGPFVKSIRSLAKRIFDRAREMESKPGHKRLEVA